MDDFFSSFCSFIKILNRWKFLWTSYVCLRYCSTIQDVCRRSLWYEGFMSSITSSPSELGVYWFNVAWRSVGFFLLARSTSGEYLHRSCPKVGPGQSRVVGTEMELKVKAFHVLTASCIPVRLAGLWVFLERRCSGTPRKKARYWHLPLSWCLGSSSLSFLWLVYKRRKNVRSFLVIIDFIGPYTLCNFSCVAFTMNKKHFFFCLFSNLLLIDAMNPFNNGSWQMINPHKSILILTSLVEAIPVILLMAQLIIIHSTW